MKIPTKKTLDLYGLSEEEWIDLYNLHDGCCHVCLEPFLEGRRVYTEHEHVKGWKKMPPEKKKLYVRGLAHWICNNRILTAGVTAEKLRNAADYLERYEEIKLPD